MATLFEKLWKISVLEGCPLCKDDDKVSCIYKQVHKCIYFIIDKQYLFPAKWMNSFCFFLNFCFRLESVVLNRLFIATVLTFLRLSFGK